MEVVSPLVGQEVRALAGLHLYHYGLSHSSQKVRMVLAEKGLVWTSHPIDLPAGEQRTEQYRRVHPNGVVPALVHDGTIVIESSDIMEYLDERFPDPPLRPRGEHELVQMRLLVARQDSLHRWLAVLSEEFLAPALGVADGARPSRSTVAGAVRGVADALAEMNRHLAARTWMVGGALSLADVAWAPAVHRFAAMRFPMGAYGALRGWYRRMRRLTSFRQAVLAHEPPGLQRRLDLYTLRRWCLRSHAGAARWRDARFLADA